MEGTCSDQKRPAAIQPLKLVIYYQGISDNRSVSEVMERIAVDYTNLKDRYGLDKSVDTNEQEAFCSKIHIAVWNFKANWDILGGIPYLKFHDLTIVLMRWKRNLRSCSSCGCKKTADTGWKEIKKVIQNIAPFSSEDMGSDGSE